MHPGVVVTKNHSMDLPDNEAVVFIYRDPRDVAVSAWFYRNRKIPLIEVIHRIATIHDPSADLYGPYEMFVRRWWHKSTVQVSYEELHSDPIKSLDRIIKKIGLRPRRISNNEWLEHLERVVDRQLFSLVKSSNMELYAHSMRKGIVGDWRNYFDTKASREITNVFGTLMIEQGYIDSLSWWQVEDIKKGVQ